MVFSFDLPLISLTIPLLVLLMFLYALLPFKWFSSSHKNLPPSPRKLPLIGNLYQLGSTPHRSLNDLAKKHGPLMLIHLGSVPMVVASTAEAAREILKTHDASFCSKPKLSLPHVLTYGSKDIAFCSYGEYWRQLKSIAVLHLLSSKQVQSFRHVREEEMRVLIGEISRGGCLVDLSEWCVTLTNNIVCRVALGRTYPGLKFRDLLRRLSFLLGVYNLGTYIPWLSWVDWLSGLKPSAHQVAKEFDHFLQSVVEEHIHKKKGLDSDHVESETSQDFVDILLDVQQTTATNLTIQSVKALILDMFAAGTESTATSIEWTISEIIRHPQVMKKLQQEAREVAQGRSIINEEDLEKMQYLKAVIKETLRLHPPAALLVPREAIKYAKLMGYDIEAGTQLVVNVWAIGRDPTLWEEPNEFRPERFLNSDIDYKGVHFKLLPFGAGRRGCPGIQFALVIYELAIANLFHNYNIELPDGKRGEQLDMSEMSGIFIHKRHSPILVNVIPRF